MTRRQEELTASLRKEIDILIYYNNHCSRKSWIDKKLKKMHKLLNKIGDGL